MPRCLGTETARAEDEGLAKSLLRVDLESDVTLPPPWLVASEAFGWEMLTELKVLAFKPNSAVTVNRI